MRSRSACWLGTALTSLVAAAALFGPARAQSALGFDLGIFLDDIAVVDSERIGSQHETVREDRSNVGILEGAIFYLHHIGADIDSAAGERLAGFRVGGEFRFLGEYATERSEGDERDKRVMGTLLELGFRGDWTAEIAARFGLTVGLRFDLAILVPGGDFADELSRLKDEGVPTSDGPRVGLALIPMVGARYAVHDRINLRFDLGLGWSYLDLLSIDAGVQGIQYVRDASFSSRRFEVSIGAEIIL